METETRESAAVFFDLDDSGSRPLVASDDSLHPVADPDRYWTETSWWAFSIPERNLGGWFYFHFRPNIGMASQGVWIWDDATTASWNLPYSRFSYHLRMPAADRILTLDEGLEWECVEPLETHIIRHHGSPQLAVELEFSAAAPAYPVGVTDRTGHFDQSMWARGEIVLNGQRLEVDGGAFRDRSWSVREDAGPARRNFYCTGTAEHFSFQLMTHYDETDTLHWFQSGFVWDGTDLVPVKSGQRQVLSRTDMRPSRIQLILTDVRGRTYEIAGQSISGAWLQCWPAYCSWINTVRWTVDGRTLIGEDHDNWTPEHVANYRAAAVETDTFAGALGLS